MPLPRLSRRSLESTGGMHIPNMRLQGQEGLQTSFSPKERVMNGPRCDCCGRFFPLGQPGSSWVNVPAIDVPGWMDGEERERCADCTKKHGQAEPYKAVKPGYCAGVRPALSET